MRRESGRDAKGDVKLETRRDERIDAEKKEREEETNSENQRIGVTFVNLSNMRERERDVQENARVEKRKTKGSTCLPFA